MIFDPHPDLGRVDGELPAQVGAGHIDEAGRLSFAAYRTDDVCEPMDRTELSLRSEAGALEVRAICGLDPWDLVLPDVARSLRGSSLFLEAERTETGVEGSVLAIVSQEAAQRWTLGEPPRPAPWSAADIRAPLLSLCELFDLLGCQVKPAGCPAERLAPCPPRVESCRGFIFPFEVEFVRAQQAGIPGLAACHEDAGD